MLQPLEEESRSTDLTESFQANPFELSSVPTLDEPLQYFF